MKAISLKIPDHLDARLAETARQRGASKSAIVREAVEAMLAASATPGKASCFELAADLIGGVRGGPDDLSHNPRHLEGYGQ